MAENLLLSGCINKVLVLMSCCSVSRGSLIYSSDGKAGESFPGQGSWIDVNPKRVKRDLIQTSIRDGKEDKRTIAPIGLGSEVCIVIWNGWCGRSIQEPGSSVRNVKDVNTP